MAASKPKFRSSTRIMVLLSTAFLITLSVAAAVGEARRCYWCGPLAEQVHRSRRAPPCGLAGREIITTCEPALPHCAVVATAPPYIESRYCVKLYQDECYPLFCNSTKTWKMTCPCRGDLCNGPNTDREIEAFTILAKLVAKTHNSRIIKRAASSSHFVKSKIISEDSDVINEDEPSPNNHIGSDERIEQENMSNILVESYTSQKPEGESQDDNLTMNENIMESTNILTINETTEALKEFPRNSRRTDGNFSSYDVQSKTDISDDYSKTLVSENLVSNTSFSNYSIEVITQTDTNKITENNGESKITHEPSEVAIEAKIDGKEPAKESLGMLMDNNIKSTEVLPTAEAFQQNDSPTEKLSTMPYVKQNTNEETKLTTASHSYTDMITENDLAELTIIPTKMHKSQKNNAPKVGSQMNLNWIILYIIYTLN